jgi:hypothetical protein
MSPVAHKHPDGDIELDFEEKAGVDPRDSEEAKEDKLTDYFRRQSAQEIKWQKWSFLTIGIGLGVVLCRFFGW